MAAKRLSRRKKIDLLLAAWDCSSPWIFVCHFTHLPRDDRSLGLNAYRLKLTAYRG